MTNFIGQAASAAAQNPIATGAAGAIPYRTNIDQTIHDIDDYQKFLQKYTQGAYNHRQTMEEERALREEAEDTDSKRYKALVDAIGKMDQLDLRDLYGRNGWNGIGAVSGNDSEEDIRRTLEAYLQGVHTEKIPRKKFDSSKEILKAGKVKHFDMPTPEEEPETPEPQPQSYGGLNTQTTPATFKPSYMDEVTPKTEEEYLGKDNTRWSGMSTAEKVGAIADLLGDAGGSIIDIIAASHGLQGYDYANKMKQKREERKQQREERKRQYQEYLNKVDDINRQIATYNKDVYNQGALEKFKADNAYRMADYQANANAKANARYGVMNNIYNN